MYDIESVKNHAYDSWQEIILSLAPHLSPMISRGRRHGPCPLCGGKDRARCHNDFNETGGVFCNQCGGGADGLAVLQWANGWDFRQAVDALRSHLGIVDGEMPPLKPIQKPEPIPEKDWSVERQRLQSIWEATEPDTGRIRQYLESRGLFVDVPPGLRLHPSLGYYHQGPLAQYPAMVARIQRNGETVGLHITYLDTDGPGKASISQPKKIRKCVENISGGAIRLFEPVDNMPLTLTEGIESALAVRDISGFPVWACGNSSLLAKAIIPESVRSVYIGADKDRSGAGQRAAEKLAQRLWDESGRSATISFPPMEIPDGEKSIDWNDYVAQEQEVARE